MKVILVGDYPFDDKIHTGIQGVLVNMTNELIIREEIDLLLVSLSNSSFIKMYQDKCEVYTLNFRSSIFKAKKEFNSIVKKEKPDIIHLQGVVPGILLFNKEFKNEFIVTQHAILSKEKTWQVSLVRKAKFHLKELLERVYFAKIRNIIFISNYNKKIYSNN